MPVGNTVAEQRDLSVLTWRISRFERVPVRFGNYSSENKVKRPLIESHYLFVANAAVRSSMSGGFGGLNGSQTSES